MCGKYFPLKTRIFHIIESKQEKSQFGYIKCIHANIRWLGAKSGYIIWKTIVPEGESLFPPSYCLETREFWTMSPNTKSLA